MGAIILVMALATAVAALSLPVFETTFLTLLLVPILASVYGMWFPLTFLSYLLLIALVILIVYRNVHPSIVRLRLPTVQDTGVFAIILFCIAFQIFYGLNLLWPDFVSIGERLRDYAILAAVYHNPINPDEPWMVGVPMQYYLYWYRFGQMLSLLLGLEIWQLYHVLGAFTYALYFSSIFFLLSKHLEIKRGMALLFSILICCGSNISGVLYFLVQDANWWGPSRVITGAITEFPVWSFLLGDLHPHYLNLCLMPLLLSILLSIRSGVRSTEQLFVFIVAGICVPLAWLYSSANPWELPVWLVFGCVWFFLYLVTRLGQSNSLSLPLPTSQGLSLGLILAVLCMSALGYSFYEAAQHLPNKEFSLAFVQSDWTPPWVLSLISLMHIESIATPGTSREELLLHWGFPIGLTVLSSLFLLRSRELLVGVVALSIVCGLASSALPLLILLLALALTIFYVDLAQANVRNKSLSPAQLLIHAMGVSAISVILVPEFFFLNDSYGGENERMNTIFKFYSASWFLLHCYALCLTAKALEKVPSTVKRSAPFRIVVLGIFILMLGFAYRTIGYRPSNAQVVAPRERGLSEMERTHPGAAKAIEALTEASPGVVLEAQGPPYSATTHVATISGKQSFLGWTNHVGLLTGLHSQIQDRERFTDSVYQESDCQQRKALLADKKITYFVVGPLETNRYPSLSTADFGCLSKLIESGGYKIFAID